MAKRKKKKRSRPRATVSAPPRRLLEGLNEADRLMRKKRWIEARDLLEALRRRYRRRPEVLTDLVNVYYELGDIVNYQHACEQLLQADPNNGDAALGLAGAYMMNFHPVLALRAFRHFLKRWPDHERAADVRETVADLEKKMPEFFADVGVSDDAAGRRIALQHEEMQVYLEKGQFQQVRRAAESLLRHDPQFTPALNNLSLAHWMAGQLDKAIEAAQRVLEFEPDNVHALSNTIHFMCASGRSDEAISYAERLKASTAPAWDRWLKKAEGLSFIGDDEGVLDVFYQAEQTDEVKPDRPSAFLVHLAAVAALRLGREEDARRYWKRSLKYQAGFALARENLADLSRPVGERNAPWPFPLNHWISPRALQDLLRFVESTVRSGNEDKMRNAGRRFLRKYPEIVGAMPILLERGDEQTREFAILLADTAHTPELLDALKDFVLSQHGSDQLRNRAAQIASEAGLLPSGPTRVWMDGEWRELLFLGFEIHDEPEQKHAPQVEKWAQEAALALRESDWSRAEQLLDRAIAIEPDAPDLLNNRAVAYNLQGRDEEAEAIIRQIHERHPDYLFARVGLAQRHIERGELEEAHELLDPLLQRKRMHFSEFDSLCGATIQLHLAEGNRDAARSWFDLWESTDLENPKLELFRWRVNSPFQPLDLVNRILGKKK